MSEINWKQPYKDEKLTYQKGKLYKVRKYTKGSKQFVITAFNAPECYKNRQEGYKICTKSLRTIQVDDYLIFLGSVIREQNNNHYVDYVFLHSQTTVIISQKTAKKFIPVYGQRWQEKSQNSRMDL